MFISYKKYYICYNKVDKFNRENWWLMINEIKKILEDFDNLLESADYNEIDSINGLDGFIENLFNESYIELGFDDYSSIPGFDPYSNDEFTNDEINTLYNFILYLNSRDKKIQGVLQNILTKLSEENSNI